MFHGLMNNPALIILKTVERDVIINVRMSSCKIPVIVISLSNLNFLHGFSKSAQISNVMKIRPVGEMFHVDGQTDIHDKDNGRFSQFCESA